MKILKKNFELKVLGETSFEDKSQRHLSGHLSWMENPCLQTNVPVLPGRAVVSTYRRIDRFKLSRGWFVEHLSRT